MTTFLYFAYGSNMLTERLQARCASARAIGGAVVCGTYDLLFQKQSVDGSGKAGLIESTEGGACTKTYGVLYEVDLCEQGALDKFEGHGYVRNSQVVVDVLNGGANQRVATYVAEPDAITGGLKPYDWYMALVIAGAMQHRLPKTYIGGLKAVPAIEDPMLDRARQQEAWRILDTAQFGK